MLEVLATSQLLQQGKLEEFDHAARAALATQPAWQNLVLYSPDGRQLLNARVPFGTPLPRTGSPELIAQVARIRAPAVSDVFTGQVSGRPMVAAAVPVIRNGDAAYVLSASFATDALTSVLLQQGVPPDGIGTLIDRNKLIIGRTRAAERFVGQRATRDLAAKMDETAEGAFLLYAKEGQAVYAAISRSSWTGWTIALGVPQAAADAPLRSSLWLLLLFCAASTFLGILAAIRGARRIAGPIASLSRGAAALMNGEPVELGRTSLAEVNEVAQAMEAASHERRHRDAAAAALAEVGRELVGTLDLTEIGKRIVSAVCEVFRVRRAVLYRVDPATEELSCLATAGQPDAAGWLGQRLAKGEGVSGQVLAQGKLLSSRDVLSDPGVVLPGWTRGRLVKDEFRAVTGVPLAARGQILGVLSLGYENDRSLTDEEIRLVSAFANQAALALENAQLFQEADRRRRTAESLADIGRLVSQSLDAEDVGQAAVESLRRLLGADYSALFRADEQTGLLAAIAVSADPAFPHARAIDFPRGIGAVGLAVERRQAVTSEDVLADPRISWTPEVRPHIEQMAVRAVLAVPLIVQDRAIGALGAGDHLGRRFNDEDIRLACAFADQVAVAMENARLHTETRQRLTHSETLLAVGQEVSGTLDSTEMMRRVARETARALGANMAGVFVADPTHSFLRPIAGYHVPKHLLAPFMAFSIPLKGHRILEEACQDQHAVALSDVAADPRVDQDVYSQFPHRSGLFCPMVVQGEPIGGLFATWFDREHRVTPAELRLVEGISRQASIALANARLVEELRTRQARLQALLAVDRQLSRIQPVRPLLAAIAEACGCLLDADSVSFRLVQGEDLVISGTWGATQDLATPRSLKVGESIAGTVAATGEPVVVADPANDPRLDPGQRDGYRRAGVRALMAMPVTAGDQVMGVLTVRTGREESFSATDVEVARAFASQAAIALENSRLYQETQRARDELSQTQAQLTQAQKMEAVGQLAGGIAHDFNNLLTVIGGRSHLLLQRLPADAPGRFDIEVIAKTADRAAALTRQLLAFSRKQLLQPEPLDLNALVDDMAPMLRRLIGEHIELVIVPGSGDGWVMADPGQIEQVVMNLVVNARDAMTDGGMLRIETHVCVLHEAARHAQGHVPPGHYVSMVVQDSGSGIDSATLNRMFEPFFTTKALGKGTGLGLATVHGIVLQSSGYIAVDSEVGRGTTFTIYLPWIPAPREMSAPRAGAAAPPSGHETVLLVEDDDGVRRLASEVLKRCGYTVLETGDPLEALVIHDRHRGQIDLLVSDMVMPAMRGPALAARVLASEPGVHVLYMSGYTDDMIKGSGEVEPAGAFLQKPFTPGALASHVRAALDFETVTAP
jgi:GAF domain-containing protein